jgi:hypothetical protein
MSGGVLTGSFGSEAESRPRWAGDGRAPFGRYGRGMGTSGGPMVGVGAVGVAGTVGSAMPRGSTQGGTVRASERR